MEEAGAVGFGWLDVGAPLIRKEFSHLPIAACDLSAELLSAGDPRMLNILQRDRPIRMIRTDRTAEKAITMKTRISVMSRGS